MTSFDLVYFIFHEDLIDIFAQHLFHDYPISCITTIFMTIPVPIDKSCKGTGVSSRIFNHGLFTNGWETRSRDVWKPVSNRTPRIISKFASLQEELLLPSAQACWDPTRFRMA